jgi:hypothetical protein
MVKVRRLVCPTNRPLRNERSQKAKRSSGKEIFDRTFVTVGPSCEPELRSIRSCTGLQDCDLSESELDRLPQLKVYEVLHADLNVEFAYFV